MKTNIGMLLLVLFLGSVTFSCKETSTAPTIQPSETVLRTLDSLEITFLEAAGGYNGYPPASKFAYIFGTLRFQNKSSVSSADSIFLSRGSLYLATRDSVLFDFPISTVYWYHDTVLAATLAPNEIDSVWFHYGFAPNKAPCGDSVYFDLVVANKYGDSLALKSPTIRFQCSY